MFRISAISVALSAGLLAGCSSAPKSPAVADSIQKSLDQSGLRNVSVKQDREKGVVTLTGNALTATDKDRAEQIAHSLAAGQVVADEVAVVPPSDAGTTKTVNADLDKGINANLDAALAANGYKHGISHSVKNGVVTLTGTVDDEHQREQLQTIASSVPNTQQVVNELQTRHEKATTTTSN